MNIEIVTGISASVFTAISSIPQLVKLIKEKKAEDVSIIMFWVLITGLALWVWYGLQKEDWVIVGSNSCSLLLNLTVLALTIKYKKR